MALHIWLLTSKRCGFCHDHLPIYNKLKKAMQNAPYIIIHDAIQDTAAFCELTGIDSAEIKGVPFHVLRYKDPHGSTTTINDKKFTDMLRVELEHSKDFEDVCEEIKAYAREILQAQKPKVAQEICSVLDLIM